MMSRNTMHALLRVTALFFVLWMSYSSDRTKGSILRDVTEENFEEAKESSFVVLVDFYAPWCGYCTSLDHQLVITAAHLEKEGIDARIVTVDATEQVGLAEREGISGFPTILMYRNGIKMGSYRGDRTHHAITDYLREKAGPVAHYVDSKDAYFAYTKEVAARVSAESDPGLVSIAFGLFRKKASSRTGGGVASSAADKFLSVASRLDHITYMITDVPDLLESYGIQNDGVAIISYGTWEDVQEGQTSMLASSDPTIPSLVGTFEVSESMSQEDLEARLVSYTVPTMFTFKESVKHIIDSLPIREHVLLFVAADALGDARTARQLARRRSSSPDTQLDPNHPRTDAPDASTQLSVLVSQKLIKEAKHIAERYRGRLLFVVVPGSESAILQHFELLPMDLPQVSLIDMRNAASPQRYNMHSGHISKSYGGGPEPARTVNEMRKKPGTENPVPTVVTKPLVEPDFLSHFLDQYVAGDMAASLRSEGIDKSTYQQTTGDSAGGKGKVAHPARRSSKTNRLVGSPYVQTIVGSQFQQAVMEDAGHVVLYIFVPWCGHCKSVEPVLADVADAYQRNSDVSFYRIDASHNDIGHPGVSAASYPMLYVFPRGGKEYPVVFDAARTTDNLVRFIARHTGVSPEDAVIASRDSSSINSEL